MSKTYAPVKYVVPGVFVEGLTLFAGKPKVGKSWFLLHAAVAVARGSFTLGEIKCPEGDALYCALEDNERRLQSRMRKLFGHDWPGTPRLTFRCEMPRLAEGGITAIEQWIASVPKPRLIIIDTLAMVRAPKKRDQSNYEADYAAGQELRALANQCGIAIVLVHHLRKADSDDPYDLVSGTLGLTGVPDSVLVLKQDAKGYTLHGRGRDLMEIEKALLFNTNDNGLWIILGNAGEVRQSNERGAILAALEEAGEPLGPNEIAAAVGAKPVNVRKLLAKLASEGRIEKVKYGKYSLRHTAAAA
jgi:predicted ATP-dependent serine protease